MGKMKAASVFLILQEAAVFFCDATQGRFVILVTSHGQAACA
jgi:hypothetical protein